MLDCNGILANFMPGEPRVETNMAAPRNELIEPIF